MSETTKCIIVDDEPAAHYVLVNYIERNPLLELTGQFYNGIDAMTFLRDHKVDLLFLDIDMPEITGLELLKIIPTPPKTILTTAHSQYALESYDHGVIDYLLKPVYFPRFLKAVDRFFSTIVNKSSEKETVDSISVKVDGFHMELDLHNLIYAQSLGNYVKLFTRTKTYLASITTAELQSILPVAHFMRIHKSYIIALDKIDRLDRDTVNIGSAAIPVGITYKRELNEVLKNKDLHNKSPFN